MNRMLKKILVGEFTLKRLIRSSLLVLCCVVAFVCIFADRLIFFPPPSSYADSDGIVRIPTSDNRTISAIHMPNPQAQYTILYSHGNGEDIGQYRNFFQALHDDGFSVLAYDYAGYGTSEGRPTEKNSYRDISAAFRYLTDHLKVDPGRIIVMGRSVGTGPSVYLAAREEVGGLVLISPFLSAFRVVTRIRILPFDKFDNLARIQNVTCPTLVVHGTDDEVIPIRHGRILYEKSNQPKQCLWLEDTGHNDLLFTAKTELLNALTDFTQSIANPPP